MAVIRPLDIEGFGDHEYYDQLQRASVQDLAETANALMGGSGNFDLGMLRQFNQYLTMPNINPAILKDPSIKAFQDRYKQAYTNGADRGTDYFPAVQGTQTYDYNKLTPGRIFGEFAKVAAMPAAGYALGPSGLGLQTGVGSQALGTGQFAAGAGGGAAITGGAVTSPVAAPGTMTATPLPEASSVAGGSTPLTAGVPAGSGGAAPVIEAGTAAGSITSPSVGNSLVSLAKAGAGNMNLLDLGNLALSWYSGSQAQDAAESAGRISNEAMLAGMDLQDKQFQQVRGDLAPYRNQGRNALLDMSSMLTDGNIPNTPNLQGFRFDPSQIDQDPYFRKRLDIGLESVDRRIGTNRMLNSGNRLTALNDYAQTMASNEFEAAYNRALKTNTQNNSIRQQRYNNDYGLYGDKLSRLYQIASMGQNAAAQTGNAGINYANSMTNAFNNNATNQVAASMYGNMNSPTNRLLDLSTAYAMRG